MSYVKCWVTTYIFTKGIIEAECLVTPYGQYRVRFGETPYDDVLRGADVHWTKEAAVERAKERRRARLKALRAQIERIEAMRFE